MPASVRREIQRREQEEEDEESADTAPSALPPRYQDNVQRRPMDIAPPDYRDALQDMVTEEPAPLNNQVRDVRLFRATHNQQN